MVLCNCLLTKYMEGTRCVLCRTRSCVCAICCWLAAVSEPTTDGGSAGGCCLAAAALTCAQSSHTPFVSFSERALSSRFESCAAGESAQRARAALESERESAQQRVGGKLCGKPRIRSADGCRSVVVRSPSSTTERLAVVSVFGALRLPFCPFRVSACVRTCAPWVFGLHSSLSRPSVVVDRRARAARAQSQKPRTRSAHTRVDP